MQGVHILTSRMLGQQRMLDMTADNMANLNTTGYKALNLEFKEVLSREHGQKVGSYVADRAITVDFEAGPIQATGNPFDLAILGDAFFAVNRDGITEYTRNGHFLLSQDNTIVDSRGYPLLDNGGGAISIPERADVTITRDGAVSTEDGVIAQLGLHSFNKEDMGQLQRTGFGGFPPLPCITPNVADDTVTLLQGNLESSNINPAMEVVRLQELSQSYQNAARLMNKIEDLESTAISKLGGGGR